MEELTVAKLKSATGKFVRELSKQAIMNLYGTTDGKAVGTEIEKRFHAFLGKRFAYAEGSAASGIDFPEIGVDLKSTSIQQPQSSSPFRDASQKIYGLAAQTFSTWFDLHTPSERAGTKGEIALFATCTVTFNLPSAGAAAVKVLEHNGYRVHYPREQTCCGMPNLDGGDIAAAQKKAAANVAALAPLVARGAKVLAPGPTCSYVLKKEYPELLGTPEAKLVAAATMDLMEFLRERMRKKELDREFPVALGKVGYHAPCHLRAQKVGLPAAQLLARVPDTEVMAVEECSAVDGTWGMKAQFYELGRKYAARLVRGMTEVDYDWIATDCPLSGLRLEKELGRPAVHPIELLAHAYGLVALPARTKPTSEDVA